LNALKNQLSMKKVTFPALIFTLLMSCGSEETANSQNPGSAAKEEQAAKVVETPIPPDIEKKFLKIMDDFEKKIKKDFWTDFTSTTRRGGEGTTETTFDATAFADYMKKKGFSLVPNTMMDYTGTEDGINVLLTEKTVSGERGGWIQQWTIKVETTTGAGSFKKQREFSAQAVS
jgi:hypothetical protein